MALSEDEIRTVLDALVSEIGADAVRKVRQAFTLKKLANLEAEITEAYQEQTEAVRELERSRNTGEWLQLPHLTKARIHELDREIKLHVEAAHRLALTAGWGLRGGITAEGVYRFSVFPLRELFTA